jgi:hypothetical protein
MKQEKERKFNIRRVCQIYQGSILVILKQKEVNS